MRERERERERMSENQLTDQTESSSCIKGPWSHQHWQLKPSHQQEEPQWLWILRKSSFEKPPESIQWNIDLYLKKTS